MERSRLKFLLSVAFASAIVTALVGLFNYRSGEALPAIERDTTRHFAPPRPPEFYYNFNPSDSVYLFGERVPLEDAEVFERFEREFLINVNDRAQMIMYLKRAGRFFPHIEKKLAEAGLPDDIKYLAVAESKLMDLRSPAGAAGIWQIMPVTGREYGLIVNDEVDERYNFELATDVAIKYLTQAYKRFGNWAVVAASYNMGMGGVSGEMNFQQTKNYYDLWLNRETSRYVFRIAAIKECMQNPAKYGYEAVAPYRPIETRTVIVEKPIPDLAQWAIEQGASFKAVKYLNPWIRGRSLPQPPARGFKILLPKNGGSIPTSEYIAFSTPDTTSGLVEK
ncbi:MAG: lytic transglycosylase domain-containing protein [Chloroherpetonaceae bacterium]|nr:lytic transglycosylase domain-containing protein [Chloroherpetonaceae bacterium]MDW8437744.1 lytic transglycosylase domain-containing protein [Chloroherpetonaceae bacterium]